jgi:D-serine deaminase-like pyridoxal phosphate-dependent protein
MTEPAGARSARAGHASLTPPMTRDLTGVVDWRAKGFWVPEAVTADEFVAAKHHLFDGAFTWPVMVANGPAIARNIATMAAFCARHGLEFAPHGKTTMAPSLFAAQLEAGATAITVATANQILACRAFGVPRVLLANELLDPVALRWIAAEEGFEVLLYVDSLAGVQAAAEAVTTTPLRVLVELGFPGGRTGCRGVAELTDLARAVAAEPRLVLAGVAAYEGGLPDTAAASRYLDEVRTAVLDLAAAGVLPEEVVVTAGGSKFFDVVADRLAGQWVPGHRLRAVLRSGAYVSHDDGVYRETTPFGRIPGEGALDAALEVWAQVTSTPEDGLAIVGMGKREAPYDAGLPMPRHVRGRDGAMRSAGGLRVAATNDHHAYLEVGPGARLEPGELVAFGISHPCTAFDKWSLIPVVADDYTVTDLIRTHF